VGLGKKSLGKGWKIKSARLEGKKSAENCREGGRSIEEFLRKYGAELESPKGSKKRENLIWGRSGSWGGSGQQFRRKKGIVSGCGGGGGGGG